jgi:hypothetical protein
MADKSLQEAMAELLDTPEVREKLWQVILDCEASSNAQIVKKAKRQRVTMEQRDRQRGLDSPPAVV